MLNYYLFIYLMHIRSDISGGLDKHFNRVMHSTSFRVIIQHQCVALTSFSQNSIRNISVSVLVEYLVILS